MKLGSSAGGVLLHCETHEARTYLHEVVDCDLVIGTFLHPPPEDSQPTLIPRTLNHSSNPVPHTIHPRPQFQHPKSLFPDPTPKTQASRDSTTSGRASSTTKVTFLPFLFTNGFGRGCAEKEPSTFPFWLPEWLIFSLAFLWQGSSTTFRVVSTRGTRPRIRASTLILSRAAS